jgi:sensor histidine kinase regulating citrate/malate metabolism
MERITLLMVIMTVVTLSVGVAALVVLYETAFEQQRQRLVETAKSWARLMEAVARFDQTYNRNYPRGARAATIKQIRDAHENFVGPQWHQWQTDGFSPCTAVEKSAGAL